MHIHAQTHVKLQWIKLRGLNYLSWLCMGVHCCLSPKCLWTWIPIEFFERGENILLNFKTGVSSKFHEKWGALLHWKPERISVSKLPAERLIKCGSCFSWKLFIHHCYNALIHYKFMNLFEYGVCSGVSQWHSLSLRWATTSCLWMHQSLCPGGARFRSTKPVLTECLHHLFRHW